MRPKTCKAQAQGEKTGEEVKFFAAPPYLENVSMCGRCGALVPTFVADSHANWHIHVLKDGDAVEAMNAALSNKDAVSATEIPKSVPNPVAKRRTPETGIA